MCAAAWRAAQGPLGGEIVVALTADEEYESVGTRAMLERGERADAAIVGEPTRLEIMPAHRGFVWIEVDVSGRAAHGSRWDVGVDAIRHAGLLLSELDRVDAEELPRREHPLLGRASLHASTIAGGIGMSTYPDRCVVRLERRTLPGERAEEVVAEIERACDAVRVRRPSFAAEVRLLMTQGPINGAALNGLVTEAAWKAKPSWYQVSTEDRMIAPQISAEMAGLIPRGRLETIEGVGHLSNLEGSEAFDAALVDHLATCGLG